MVSSVFRSIRACQDNLCFSMLSSLFLDIIEDSFDVLETSETVGVAR